MRKTIFTIPLLVLMTGNAMGAEPADQFSRANCFNNESITYNFFDPPQYRFVSSFHYLNNVFQHYVTENPAAACRAALPGEPRTVSGQYCLYNVTLNTRHAAVHGAFASSEPNPDGNLTPMMSTAWSVRGNHSVYIPGVGVTVTNTNASNCNLHFDQFY